MIERLSINPNSIYQVKSVETIHWYYGSPLHLYYINEEERKLVKVELGVDEFQFAFPRGVWFTRLCEVEDGYSLVGASVAPGFDFQVHTRTLYSISF